MMNKLRYSVISQEGFNEKFYSPISLFSTQASNTRVSISWEKVPTINIADTIASDINNLDRTGIVDHNRPSVADVVRCIFVSQVAISHGRTEREKASK